jgi:protein-tyrosine phosphatase
MWWIDWCHCLGDIGRTGTVMGCYLKRKYGLSREEVMQRIADLREGDIYAYKTSPEGPIQVDMVRNYRLKRNIINL